MESQSIPTVNIQHECYQPKRTCQRDNRKETSIPQHIKSGKQQTNIDGVRRCREQQQQPVRVCCDYTISSHAINTIRCTCISLMNSMLLYSGIQVHAKHEDYRFNRDTIILFCTHQLSTTCVGKVYCVNAVAFKTCKKK